MAMSIVPVEPKTLATLVEYDLFPYVVFREIHGIREDGAVTLNGSAYRPTVILPYEVARQMYEKIKAARYEYEAAERKAKDAAMEKIRAIAPAATAMIHVYSKKTEDK